MPNRELLERARMFEERADRATDPISRQHYREMAAHSRALSNRADGHDHARSLLNPRADRRLLFVPNPDTEILDPPSRFQLRDQPARPLATTGPSL